MTYDLPTELFTELGIRIVIFAVKFYARWKFVGVRGFGFDNLFAGIAIVSDSWSYQIIQQPV